MRILGGAASTGSPGCVIAGRREPQGKWVSGIRAERAEIEGSEISLREEDYSTSGDWCNYECPFDVTSHIPDVAPGSYTLSIYRYDDTTPTDVVEITAQ